MSISGVRDKISLRLVDGELVPAAERGEYILKPVPSTPLPAFPDEVPSNEHLTMQIASQVFGIDTAANALVDFADGEHAYVCRRFDRVGDRKLQQEDCCSLAGRSEDTHGRNYKYDGSYEELGWVVARHCHAAPVALDRLFRRLVAVYLLGNGDAHWRNFSVMEGPLGHTILTPAYDLVCTTLHLPAETPLALDLFADGGETPTFQRLGFPSGSDFLELARRFGLPAARAERHLAALATARDRIHALAERSFLSPEARAAYLRIVEDRFRALAHR